MKSYYIDLNQNISVANIWIDGGTYLDKKTKKGINQILTTLLTRGCGNFNNLEFSNYINSYGAELNFEAFEDGISICLKSSKEYFDKLYPLIRLLIEEPNLYEKEFLICKKQALDIIFKSKESLFNKTFDNWKQILYKDHPYSFNSNGYIDNINQIEYDDILYEYESFQKRKKYLLTNIMQKDIIKINNFKMGSGISNEIKLKTRENDNNFIWNYAKSKQLIFILGAQTCPHSHQDNLALKLLESYLSFGMSSLLFKTFREKNGLTYESGVFFPTRKFNAPFLIYLSVGPKNALLAFDLLISIWKDLVSKLIDNEDLSIAKLKLKTSFLHNYQTVEEITYRKVNLMGIGIDPFHDEKTIKEIEYIDSEEILSVCQRYFKFLTLSISGSKLLCKQIKDRWNKYN